MTHSRATGTITTWLATAILSAMSLLLLPTDASAHLGWHGFTRLGPLTSVLVYGSIPLIVSIVLLSKVMFRNSGTGGEAIDRRELRALKRRHARGEINQAEYEKQRRRVNRDS